MSATGYIIDSDAGMRDVLARCKRVAILGIKTEAQAGQPAYYVPKYMQAAGYEIIPVPVYYPDVTQILGLPVYRRLADVPGQIDLVNVFRRPADVTAHVTEIVEA